MIIKLYLQIHEVTTSTATNMDYATTPPKTVTQKRVDIKHRRRIGIDWEGQIRVVQINDGVGWMIVVN